jgi:hypothetical protein
MWQRTVDCLGIAVSIETDVSSIEGQLAALFRTYADAPVPATRYELRVRDWPVVIRDGEVIARYDSALDLVAGLELDLYTFIVARTDGIVLHAGAVVGTDGRALVFAGVSGAGKSTLLRALLGRGFRYLTEECVALLADGRCRGLARALHVEDDAATVPTGFACDEYQLQTDNGLRRTRLFHPPPSTVWHKTATPAVLLHLHHGPVAPDTAQRLSAGEAVHVLSQTAFRGATTTNDLAALTRVPCVALFTSSAANALRLACDVAEEYGVVPF